MLFLYTSAGAAGFFVEQLARPAGSINGPEVNELRRRHGWEIVRLPPSWLVEKPRHRSSRRPIMRTQNVQNLSALHRTFAQPLLGERACCARAAITHNHCGRRHKTLSWTPKMRQVAKVEPCP